MLEIIKLQNEIFGPVSMDIQAGQSVIVRGPSGSGKTRFMRAVADLDEAKGNIFLNAQDRNDLSGHEWRKRVRFVTADSSWWFETVEEHFPKEFDLASAMTKLGLKPELINMEVTKLSTGERQRLAFLRSIADEPQVLLLDEPTSALDKDAANKLEIMIEELKAKGTILFIASHNATQVERFGPKEILFDKAGITIKN